jgi:hypothetical protein
MNTFTVGQTVVITLKDSPLRGRRAVIVDCADGLYDVRPVNGHYRKHELTFTARELAPVQATEKVTA